MSKTVVFRVDSNSTISSGHVMRCLALADSLSDLNIISLFITSDGDMTTVIERRGYSTVSLDSDWQNLLMDFPYIITLLKGIKPLLVLVDTYSVTNQYVSELNKFCPVAYLGCKRIRLKDVSLLINYEIDIDYSFYNTAYDGKAVKLLLGSEYAPLRKQFKNVPIKFNSNVKTVLITLGNSANLQFLISLIRKIETISAGHKIQFQLILGHYFSECVEINDLMNEFNNIKVLSNVSNMANIMQCSDVAISACGTTVYELGACSVPTIGFSLVEEQTEIAESLLNAKAILYAGEAFSDPIGCAFEIINILETLIVDDELRRTLAVNLHKITDGNGSDRIAEAINLFCETADLE